MFTLIEKVIFIIRMNIQYYKIIACIVFFSTSCSCNKYKQYKIDKNLIYVHTSVLRTLNMPHGMIIPNQNNKFAISSTTKQNQFNQIETDITPPVQPIALFYQSKAKFFNKKAVIFLKKRYLQDRELWSKIIIILYNRGYHILFKNDKKKILYTDTICWNGINNKQYIDHYKITLTNKGNQILLQVCSIKLQHNNKIVNNTLLIQRYTVQLLNNIIFDLNKLNVENNSKNKKSSTKNVVIKVKINKNQYPLLIINQPYTMVWNNLPIILPYIGMKIKNSNVELSEYFVKYIAFNKKNLKTLGILENFHLHNGIYKIQLGDLNQYSSLEFFNPQGYMLSKLDLEKLAKIFQIEFNKVNKKIY